MAPFGFWEDPDDKAAAAGGEQERCAKPSQRPRIKKKEVPDERKGEGTKARRPISALVGTCSGRFDGNDGPWCLLVGPHFSSTLHAACEAKYCHPPALLHILRGLLLSILRFPDLGPPVSFPSFRLLPRLSRLLARFLSLIAPISTLSVYCLPFIIRIIVHLLNARDGCLTRVTLSFPRRRVVFCPRQSLLRSQSGVDFDFYPGPSLAHLLGHIPAQDILSKPYRISPLVAPPDRLQLGKTEPLLGVPTSSIRRCGPSHTTAADSTNRLWRHSIGLLS